MKTGKPTPTCIITGEKGIGKTTLIHHLSEGRRIQGILSLPKKNSVGEKTGILVKDIASGAQMVLAEVVAGAPFPHGSPFSPGAPFPHGSPFSPGAPFPHGSPFSPGAPFPHGSPLHEAGPRIGPYRFSASALAFAMEVLTGCIGNPTPTVLDEIGPLELFRGEGLMPVLPELFRSALPLLAVVRPSLIDQFRAELLRFRCGDPVVVTIRAPGDRSALVQIIHFLEGLPEPQSHS